MEDKIKVGRRRIVKALHDGSRTVSDKTLEKYGFVKNDKGEVIINEEDKIIEKKKHSGIIMSVEQFNEMSDYDINNNLINSKQIKNWVISVLTIMPKTEGASDFRAPSTIRDYFRIPDTLFSLYKKDYDSSFDLTNWFEEHQTLIDIIDTSFTTISAKKKLLGKIVFLSQHFIPLKKCVNYDILNNQYIIWCDQENLNRIL
jgi:hypothetical protein